MPKVGSVGKKNNKEILRRIENLKCLFSFFSPVPEEWKKGGRVSVAREGGDFRDVMKLVKGVRFLVPGWIPFGMVTLVVAPPGVGKSAFVLFALVRTIILGGLQWFNGEKRLDEPGYVLWCDTEGSNGITVQRIEAWGLPPERILTLFKDDPLRPIDLGNEEHLKLLKNQILERQIVLAVIDSLRGAHPGDENSSTIHKILQALTKIAEETGAAIVVIHHSRKLGIDEGISANAIRGSSAINAMARAAIGLDKPDPESEYVRGQMLKENLGLRPEPFGFRVTNSGLEFGPVPRKPRSESKTTNGIDWLRNRMEPGKWYRAKDIENEAGLAGIPEMPLKTARQKLGIVKPNVRKVKDGWEWRLPMIPEKKE